MSASSSPRRTATPPTGLGSSPGTAGDQADRASQWFGIIDHAYHLASLPLSQRSWLYSGQDFAVSAGLAPIFGSARRTRLAAYQAAEAGLLPHTLWQSTNGQTA